MPRLASSLLPLAFGEIEQSSRLVVLDLGRPTPEGIAFLNNFRCTVYYVGFRDRAHLFRTSEEGEVPDFRQFLNIREGTQFDLFLLWDCLNFIDFHSMCNLSEYLEQFVSDRTCMHGFLAFSTEVPLAITKFRLLNKREVDVEEVMGTSCPFPHTTQQLEDGFAAQSVRRGVLLPHNRREVLFGQYGVSLHGYEA